MGFVHDESLGHQDLKGLPHGVPGDAERRREALLAERCSRRQLAEQNPFTEDLGDALCCGGPPEVGTRTAERGHGVEGRLRHAAPPSVPRTGWSVNRGCGDVTARTGHLCSCWTTRTLPGV